MAANDFFPCLSFFFVFFFKPGFLYVVVRKANHFPTLRTPTVVGKFISRSVLNTFTLFVDLDTNNVQN